MMLRLALCILAVVANSSGVKTKTCGQLSFKANHKWPTQHIIATKSFANPQLCVTACHDDTFCNWVGYDFATQQCVMSAKNQGGCQGSEYTSISQDLLLYFKQSSKISFNCFKCAQDKIPAWAKGYTHNSKNVWNPTDVNFVTNRFKKPQCEVGKMVTNNVVASNWKGRWYGMYVLGGSLVNTQAILLDNFYQEGNKNIISRMIRSSTTPNGNTCTERYITWQEQAGDLWELTVGYTGNTDFIPWGSVPRLNSYTMRCLTLNGNQIVWYGCMVPYVNGTCPPSQVLFYVFLRTKELATHASELKTFEIFPNALCITQQLQTLNVNDPCIAQYDNKLDIYDIKENCDYTNQTWMASHSTQPTYAQQTSAKWSSVLGTIYGQLSTVSFDSSLASQGKLSVAIDSQPTNNGNDCDNRDTALWAVNSTTPPSTNLWTLNLTLTDTTPTVQQQEWYVAYDSILNAGIGCLGAVPCQNATASTVFGMRRYRKLSVYEYRTKVFPLLAKACVDPTEIPVVKAVRLADGLHLCNQEKTLETSSCQISDVKKYGVKQIDKSKLVGSWVLANASTIKPMTSMGCSFTTQSNYIDVKCYENAQGICDGPYLSKLLFGSEGQFTWEFTDPVLKEKKETVTLLYQDSNMLVFYGCSATGADPLDKNKSCRDDRMLAYVFVQPTYTLTAADLTNIQTLYDNVCLYTPTQLYPLATSDSCFAPILGGGSK